jgi:hypothetical protein
MSENESLPRYASLLGLGFQFNHDLYAAAGNVSQYPGYIAGVEGAIEHLRPQFVRVFVAGKILNDSAVKSSFLRTLALAAGNAAIGEFQDESMRKMRPRGLQTNNYSSRGRYERSPTFIYLTWWYDLSEPAIEQFTDLIVSVLSDVSIFPQQLPTASSAANSGASAVTQPRLLLNIQNEPNGPGRTFTWEQYRDAYLTLHSKLVYRKVRDGGGFWFWSWNWVLVLVLALALALA